MSYIIKYWSYTFSLIYVTYFKKGSKVLVTQTQTRKLINGIINILTKLLNE